MVILRILDLPLEEGVTHEATDWQVSDQPSFATKALESLGDKKNLSTIIFNEVLDPNIKWYARARARLSTGYTIWGNLDIFLPENDNVIDASEDLPSRIAVPQITTSSDPKDHDVSMFTIHANGFEVLGNGSLSATTWFIEDIDGKVIWSSAYNTTDKTSIDITNVILKANQVYRIKVMFHSTSQDSSPIGCLTIKTSENSDINLNTYLDWVEPGEPIELISNKIEGVNSVTWSLISVNDNIAKVLWSTVTQAPNEFTVTMPTNILGADRLYLLKIDPDKEGLGSKFIPFRTRYSGVVDETPPELIVPEDIVEEIVIDHTLNHPYVFNAKHMFRDSSLTGKDIMALEDIYDFPITIVNGTEDTFTTYQQDNIGDFYTRKLNGREGTKLIFDLGKSESVRNYLRNNSIPYFQLNNYKGIEKPLILPLNDRFGGNLIKDLSPYVPVDGLEGRDILAQVILDSENNIVDLYYKPDADYNLQNGVIGKQFTKSDYGYPFVLIDGNDYGATQLYNVKTKRLVNGVYKLVLIDLQDRKKHVIPFSIVGEANRSPEDTTVFGFVSNGALVNEHTVEANKGTTHEVPFVIVGKRMPTVMTELPVGIKVTSFRVERVTDSLVEGQETQIAELQEKLASKGLDYKLLTNKGKLVFEVGNNVEMASNVITYTSEDSETYSIIINVPGFDEELPEEDTFPEDEAGSLVDHEHVVLSSEERENLGITTRDQLDKVLKAYSLERYRTEAEYGPPYNTRFKELTVSDYLTITNELKALSAAMASKKEELEAIDYDSLKYIYKNLEISVRAEVTAAPRGDSMTSVPAVPQPGDYSYEADKLIFAPPTNKFELVFNSGFYSVKANQFNMGEAALTKALTKSKFDLEYGKLRNLVKDKATTDYEPLKSDSDFPNMTNRNLSVDPNAEFGGKYGEFVGEGFTNKEAIDIAVVGKIMESYYSSGTTLNTQYSTFRDSKLQKIGVTYS